MLTSKNFGLQRRNPLAPKSDSCSKVKPKKCGACREAFTPVRPLQSVCSPKCAQEIAERKRLKEVAKREQEERKKTRAQKLALKPRKWWLKKAKTALHEYIRTRDEGKPCISCGTPLLRLGRPGGDYDAGHFRAVGSAKHLEFVENNIHGQCKHCNDYLKGNRDGYEAGLIKRFGPDYVEALKNDDAQRHLTIQDFQEIERKYKALTKQLQRDKEVA